MVKIVAAVGAVGLLLGPTLCLVTVGTVLNPVAQASCPGTGPAPAELTAELADGSALTLDQTQLRHAATIASIGRSTPGVGDEGVIVALMAALTESGLRMLSNVGAYPGSGDFPNDGDGSDGDSLGLFQMRPAAGWGSVEQLMNSEYQARAFFGGSTGPNRGSPRGLLDIDGWQLMPSGAAAQAVEVSAFPDRYANYQPTAQAIIDALAPGRGTGSEYGCGPCESTSPPPGAQSAPPEGDATYALGPVSPALERLVEILAPKFGVTSVGGYRPSARDPGGHPSGNAADFMVPSDGSSWATAEGRRMGDQLAAYAQAHAAELHVDYIIWWQRIWSSDRAAEGWRAMEDRGSHNENHRNHVHINVAPGAPGDAAVTDCTSPGER